MKQFYACEHKKNLSASKTQKEWVEYDINTLIRDEAVMLIEFDDSLEPMSDEEYDALVDKKTKEIKDELMQNGIYKNVNGRPVFLYC